MRQITIIALALLATAAFAQRKPTVTYSVSGSAGAWDLNFNVQNNLLPGEGRIYFFGVYLDTGRDIQGTPANWDANTWTVWDNSGFGGSSTQYNNNWINLNFNGTDIGEGGSQSGYVARYSGANAPGSVRFFAYAFGGSYNGNDNFNSQGNPGWEGDAVVPEPASMIALGAGLAAVAARRRRK